MGLDFLWKPRSPVVKPLSSLQKRSAKEKRETLFEKKRKKKKKKKWCKLAPMSHDYLTSSWKSSVLEYRVKTIKNIPILILMLCFLSQQICATTNKPNDQIITSS